jgi:hypothetical protein
MTSVRVNGAAGCWAANGATAAKQASVTRTRKKGVIALFILFFLIVD